MNTKSLSTSILTLLIALLLSVLLLLPACSGGKNPNATPTATPPVTIGETSFADGRGLQIGFKLLYALDSQGGNNVLGTSTLSQILAAIKLGASGNTDAALAEALGMQGMQPRQVSEVALRMRQTISKITQGRFTTAWGLFIGDRQYIKESYKADCTQYLKMTPTFLAKKYDNESGNKYLGEWADENTGGRVKAVNFNIPVAPAPYFMDILQADPQWQLALDTGKTRPMPFKYDNGEKNAVPTMVCYQKCGIYEGGDGFMAVLPTAQDEARLVILFPPEAMTLHDFIPVAAAKHDEWLDKAEWADQRVLLPRFQLNFEGSAMDIMGKAGLGELLAKGSDYSGMGEGLYFADILHVSSLVVDESGIDPPNADVVYRQGIKDGIRTLAVDRPFIVMLEKTDPDGAKGQVLMMGFVREPLDAATK